VGPAGRGIEATSVPIKNDTIILIKKEEWHKNISYLAFTSVVSHCQSPKTSHLSPNIFLHWCYLNISTIILLFRLTPSIPSNNKSTTQLPSSGWYLAWFPRKPNIVEG
jgi:hypothetical protein